MAGVLPTKSLARSSRPLRLVVPLPSGGVTDITARIITEPLSHILGQSLVVGNRAGAGGSIGMTEISRAAPDELTVGLAAVSTHGVDPALYAKWPYDPLTDFVAITELVKAPVC